MSGQHATRIRWIIALGIIMSSSVRISPAEEPDDADSARTSIANMERALGGERAPASLTGLAVTASCSGPADRTFRYGHRTIEPNGVLAQPFVVPK